MFTWFFFIIIITTHHKLNFIFAADVKKAMASKLVLQRRLFRLLQLLPPSSSSSTHAVPFLSVKASGCTSLCRKNSLLPPFSSYSRNLCSGSFNLDESQAPLTIDYRYVIVFHLMSSYLIILCRQQRQCSSISPHHLQKVSALSLVVSVLSTVSSATFYLGFTFRKRWWLVGRRELTD